MRMLHPKPKGPRGVTLIEVMVSMAIFSIGILGILQLSVIASTQNGFAKRQAQATNIARDLIDSFERLPFTHPAFTDGSIGRTSNQFCNVGVVPTEWVSLASDFGSTARPLLGASRQIALSDGYQRSSASTSAYDVRWRVDTVTEPNGGQAHYICIAVRFTPPGSAVRQINFFTVKNNPATMVGTGTSLEI